MMSSLSLFWSERTPRERRMLGLGAAMLLAILCWLVLLAPALQARAQWQKDLPALRADLAQMQAWSQELRSRPVRAVSSTQTINKINLERSLADKGMKAQSLNLNQSSRDTQVQLSFTDTSFSALTEWLQQVQGSMQLVVIDASVTAKERIDRVDAKFSLRKAS